LTEETLPPRYAIESDDEDEFNPLNKIPNPTKEESEIQVTISPATTTNVGLIIASGVAGNTWARGANLNEQSGIISVNGVQVALVFNPPWTKSNIIISEVFSELPLHAMHPYAETILDSLKPSSVSLLDSYSVPTYATSHPVPIHDTPIRYLTTSSKPNFLDNKADLFKPPNLIQSTSASFLSILSLRGILGTLILLPTPYISLTRPRQISPSSERLNQDNVDWSPTIMKTVHSLLFKALEGEPVHNNVWEHVQDPLQDKSTKRRTQVGEGGMYM